MKNFSIYIYRESTQAGKGFFAAKPEQTIADIKKWLMGGFGELGAVGNASIELRYSNNGQRSYDPNGQPLEDHVKLIEVYQHYGEKFPNRAYDLIVTGEVVVYCNRNNAYNDRLSCFMKPNATVAELKKVCCDRWFMEVAENKLYFNGRELADDRLLSDYGIVNNARVDLMASVVQARPVGPQNASRTPPRRGVCLAVGGGIGATVGALTSTAIALGFDYFARGTAEQLGMTFGIAIPVGALLGAITGELVFRRANREYMQFVV